MFPPRVSPVLSCFFLLYFPLCKLPLPLLTLKKRLYLREQDTGRGMRFSSKDATPGF